MKLFFVVCMLMISVMADGWNYHVKINNMGSRSEGKTGILSYNGFELPGKLGKILTPEGGYEFLRSTVPWGSKGWQNTSAIQYKEISDKFSAQLHDKWYTGAKRSGTPAEWCYLPSFDTWINPIRIKEYCLTELKNVKDIGTNPFGDLFGEGIEKEELEPLPPVDKKVSVSDNGWDYTVKITNKGSKSQGSIGVLTYKGYEIPDSVGTIYTPDGAFYYARSEYLWGDSGWQKYEYKPETSKEKYAECKWYKGARQKDTPVDWCYLVNMNIWINPEYIQEYLTGIPQTTVPDFLEKIPPKRGKK